MAVVFLALGTNLGDREENLRSALRLLRENVRLVDSSPVYETQPWGVKDQPDFLNMVVSGETDLEPFALLRFLKGIERAIGRTPGIRYGPRVIDMDILSYDKAIVRSSELTVPHPRMTERRFVLVPLADIAPDWVHPLLGMTIKELLSSLPDDGSVKPYSPPNQ